jgi:hypothetical protein
MTTRVWMFTLLAATAHAPWGGAGPGELHRRTFLGAAPPELASEPGQWLGTAPPVTLAGLRGRVVWLQFNF